MTDLLTFQLIQPPPDKHDNIDCSKLPASEPKTFSHDALYPVSLNSCAYMFLRNNEAKPGIFQICASGQNQQVAAGELEFGFIENRTEVFGRQKPEMLGIV